MAVGFLQSPEWEGFQKSVGRKTWRVRGALIVKHGLPLGLNYLYCPRPSSGELLEDAYRIAQEEGAIFLKIDSAYELRIPPNYKYRQAKSLQPQKTIFVDLRNSEGDLLYAMHEKTRYNIRLAERHGIEVNQKGTLEEFWKLLAETAERDKFYTHERDYYGKLLAVRSKNFSNELFFVKYRGVLVAAAIINFFKPPQTATYLHGASSREYKEVMAPHLLHWRIIQEAKRRGFSLYDMWGIDEKRWPGLTRFKLGFGGEIVEYPLSVDIVYRQAFYGAYNMLRKIL